jgi:predicted nucleotidyltransferase
MSESTSTYRVDRNELAQLCREHGIVFAGLFGSQAREEASSASDVDLLVRFEERQSLIDLARIEREIEEAIGQSVDLVTENALSPYLRDRVTVDLEVIVDDE